MKQKRQSLFFLTPQLFATFLVGLFLAVSMNCFGQIEKDTIKSDVTQLFTIVDEVAHYPKGMKGFYKYVSKTLKYPKEAKIKGVQGKVYVQFIIETDGTLSNFKIVRGIGAGCNEEVLRVIKKCPKWNPGKENGKVVRQRMVIPINFTLR